MQECNTGPRPQPDEPTETISTDLWLILILLSLLQLDFPKCLFPPGVPTNTLYASLLFSHMCACKFVVFKTKE